MMEKARVLQVGKYFPPVPGGIETISKDLGDALAQLGVCADVLCSNITATSAMEDQEGYSVHRIASFGRFLSTPISPSLPLALRRLAREYSIIHLHHPNPLATLALYLARPDKPIVVHWHSDIVRQRVSYGLFEPFEEWMLRRADAVIAASPPYLEASESLARYREKARVIPYGIDIDRLQGQESLVASIRQSVNGRKLVFALGRLVYYKGFDVLIDAAALLPDTCAVIIGGEGPLRGALEARIRGLNLGHRVRLVASISNDELGSYYDAADIFCLSSTARSEAFGIVQLEAMRFGKPVVASDIEGSGVGWVNSSGVSGINVAPGSPQALAAAIRQLLFDEKLLRDLGKGARSRVLSQFTSTRMAQQVRDLYLEVLQGARVPAG